MPVSLKTTDVNGVTITHAVLSLDDNTSVETNLYGATVEKLFLKGKDRLFVSGKAIYDNKKAIRGGIPVCFPQFGPWDLGPQHGFARISTWTLLDQADEESVNQVKVENEPSDSCTFELTDSEETKKAWPFSFRALVTLVLTPTKLHQHLRVVNSGSDAFDFTALLHTYFRASNSINNVKVTGLKDLVFVDKLKDAAEFKEDRTEVFVDQAYDRVYQNTPSEHTVDLGNGDVITLTKQNFPDTVVWNPWVENAKKMGDFGDEEYVDMICVEAGACADRVSLAGGASWVGTQIIALA